MSEGVDGLFRVTGPVTLENVLELRERINTHLQAPQCVVDFSGATEVDSAAVGLMLDCLRRGKASGADVRFSGLGESISSLIDLYGVGDLLVSSRK